VVGPSDHGSEFVVARPRPAVTGSQSTVAPRAHRPCGEGDWR
jgi:hypothetical protein